MYTNKIISHQKYNIYQIFLAIDDIINQIKGGRFTLKHTDVSIKSDYVNI